MVCFAPFCMQKEGFQLCLCSTISHLHISAPSTHVPYIVLPVHSSLLPSSSFSPVFALKRSIFGNDRDSNKSATREAMDTITHVPICNLHVARYDDTKWSVNCQWPKWGIASDILPQLRSMSPAEAISKRRTQLVDMKWLMRWAEGKQLRGYLELCQLCFYHAVSIFPKLGAKN